MALGVVVQVLQEHVSGSVSRVEEGGPLAVSSVEGQDDGEDLDFVAMMVQVTATHRLD